MGSGHGFVPLKTVRVERELTGLIPVANILVRQLLAVLLPDPLLRHFVVNNHFLGIEISNWGSRGSAGKIKNGPSEHFGERSNRRKNWRYSIHNMDTSSECYWRPEVGENPINHQLIDHRNASSKTNHLMTSLPIPKVYMHSSAVENTGEIAI